MTICKNPETIPTVASEVIGFFKNWLRFLRLNGNQNNIIWFWDVAGLVVGRSGIGSGRLTVDSEAIDFPKA